MSTVIHAEPIAGGQIPETLTSGDVQTFHARCADDPTLHNQVERILHSEELHGSLVLRRLLIYLAEKSICGEADELKEFTVAVDGLGRPSSYDPRHNSAVRIQVGRLRQKLADYYQNEGKDDPVVIELPKGRFKLKYEMRNATSPVPNSESNLPEVETDIHSYENVRRAMFNRFRLPIAIVAGILLALAVGAMSNWLKPSPANATSATYTSTWNADMEDLWHPYIATRRPMIVAIEDPLFVELDGKKGVYYRDKTLNSWQDIESSPTVGALRSALKNREMAPSRYYTPFGEVDASFLLAKMLGSRVQNLTVVKTSDFSMRELAENNVVFVGIEDMYFTEEMHAAPIKASLEQVNGGIRNLNPEPGEPEMFVDQYTTAPTENGTVYALVTHLPGPLGGNDVESFTSNRSAGYLAAVRAFTDPESARTLAGELKRAAGGNIPRYYQVLLKVNFAAEVPTEITYVLARELKYPVTH